MNVDLLNNERNGKKPKRWQVLEPVLRNLGEGGKRVRLMRVFLIFPTTISSFL